MSKEKFDREIKIRNLTKNTSETYWAMITKLERFAGKNLSKINEEDIKRYLVNEHDRGRKGKTYIDLYAFKFYFRDVLERRWDILITRQKRAPQKLPNVISISQAKLLFQNIANDGVRLALMLCYGCGLRISEALSIKPSNIFTEQGLIRIVGKGNKERATVLPKYLLFELRRYWWIYRRGTPADSFLFMNRETNSVLNYQTVFSEFKEVRAKLNLPTDVCIHSLRHSFATEVQKQGIDLLTLQYMMGHSSIQTTRRYLHLSLTSNPSICSPIDQLYTAA